MSIRANPTVVGSFVLGAIILLAAAIIFYGTGQYFTPKKKFIIFFDGSVKGLQVGGSVTFRGARIGQVTNIVIQLDQDTQTVRVPIIIQIEPDRIKEVQGKIHNFDKLTEALIQHGLRAQLKMESFVTGQLYVDLDFYQDSPLTMAENHTKYMQIPTVPSSTQEINQLITSARRSLDAIEKIATSKELKQGIADFVSTLKEAKRMAKTIDQVIGAENVQAAIDNFNETLVATKKMAEDVDKLVSSSDISEAVKAIKSTAEDTQNLVVDLNNQADPALIKFEQAMSEFNQTLISIRNLTDYLSRHPEALLRGKSKESS